MLSVRPAAGPALIGIAVVFAALVAATQWTAAMLAYQPALGAPWLDLVGIKLYAPWKVFARGHQRWPLKLR
jgi:type IV secretion system protein VirD4